MGKSLLAQWIRAFCIGLYGEENLGKTQLNIRRAQIDWTKGKGRPNRKIGLSFRKAKGEFGIGVIGH